MTDNSFAIELGDKRTKEPEDDFPEEDVDPHGEYTAFERGMLEYCREWDCLVYIHLGRAGTVVLELDRDIGRVLFEFPDELASFAAGKPFNLHLWEIGTKFIFCQEGRFAICNIGSDRIPFATNEILGAFRSFLRELCDRAEREGYVTRQDANAFCLSCE